MSREGKRVLFLINSFAVGGAERVFIDDLQALQKRGWEVHAATLFSRGALASELDDAQIPIYELAWKSVFDWRGVLRLRKLVRNLAPAVMYSSLNEANGAARLVRLLGASVRLFTREANMADAKGLKYKIIDVLLGWLSSRIVAVSKAVGDSQCAYAPWLRSRMAVLYNGTDVSRPVPVRGQDCPPRLLTVGSLTEKKDHEILLRAMVHLPEDVRLTVVGAGPLEGKLAKLADSLELSERVHFIEHVPHDAMYKIYESHDVFVLPSKREGCPNVVSEAQAAGLPVVAFAIPGIDEFVSSQSGIVVHERTPKALAQSIVSLLANSPVVSILGRAGYLEVCKNRSNDVHNRALLELFR